MDLKVNPDEYLPLRDVVFKTIRGAIISGKIQPGTRLMEKQLAAEVGVSRTPVREALRKLELEGFVQMFPRKGAVVSIISEKDIKDVLEIRSALEALAAKLACENRTDELVRTLEYREREYEKAMNETSRQGDIDVLADKDQEFHDAIFLAADNPKLSQMLSNLREQIYRYRIAYLKDETYRLGVAAEHEKIAAAIAAGDKTAAEAATIEHISKQKEAITRSIKL